MNTSAAEILNAFIDTTPVLQQMQRGGWHLAAWSFPHFNDQNRICLTCLNWLNEVHHDDHGGRGHMCMSCGGGAHFGHTCYDCA
jgi:hypothetical protein